jgi:spore coat protein U-like protein
MFKIQSLWSVRPVLIASSLLLSCSLNQAFAGSTSASTQASATIGQTCSVSANDVDFGELTPGSTSPTVTQNIAILCTKGTTYSYNITYSSNDYATGIAHMSGAKYGDSIYYYMSNHSGGYFSGANNDNAVTGTGTGNWVNDTTTAHAYGTAGNISSTLPFVHPDSYSDTISLVLTY